MRHTIMFEQIHDISTADLLDSHHPVVENLLARIQESQRKIGELTAKVAAKE